MSGIRKGKREADAEHKGMISVQYKIIAVLVPIIIAGIALITIFVCDSSMNMLEKTNIDMLSVHSRSTVYEVVAWTNTITARLQAQLSVIEFLEDEEEQKRYIRRTADPASPYPDGLYIATRDGRYMFANWQPEPDYDPTERGWYQEGLKHDRFTFGNAYFDLISNQIVVSVTCAIKGTDGQVRGVAGCDIQLDEVSNIVSSMRLERSGGTFLVDAGTQILLGAADKSLTGRKLSDMADSSIYAPVRQLIEKQRSSGERYGFHSISVNGAIMYYYLEDVPGCDWVAVSYVPKAEVMGEANTLALTIVIIGLVTVLALICFVYLLLFRLVITPTGRLDASVQRIADGNLDVSIDVNSNDEFGRLAGNLGKMTDRLHSYIGYIDEIVTALSEIGSGNLEFRPQKNYEGEFARVKDALIHITQSLSAAKDKEETAKRLENEKNAADSANRAKSRFLAQMSHEIRTPINAVLGMNEMILNESKEEQTLDYASNIDSAGHQLLSLINTILDFSKIEDGKMEIVPADYDLASVINNLVNGTMLRAKMKSLTFNVDIDETLPAMLHGDDVRVTQVIQNILTNAVKYTEEGSVTFTIKNGGRDGEDVFLDVSVADTGIGIREEDMDKLCASFERLDTQRNRHIEGTGLGMAIVTNLLQMMGSKLQVDSVYGEGSTFSFRLRQRVVDERPIGNYSERLAAFSRHREKDVTMHAPEAKVLVVDDNDMNLKVAKNLLKLNGIRPDLAKSGAESVNLIREREYDIVFMDHMMPVMDGVETLILLKREGLIRPGMSVIVLTANAVAGAREEYLAAGFVDYLSKPMNVQDLEDKLVKYLPGSKVTWRKRTDGAEAPAAETAQTTPAAEDIPQTDADAGAQADTPNDGAKAGAADVMEFHPQEEALEFGAEEVLEFDAEEVLEFGAAEDSGAAASPNAEDVLKRVAAAGIHTESGLQYCSNDQAFYQELLNDFTTEYPEKARELIGFYEVENWGDYRIRIHALKSIAKTIGADDLFEQARDLENAASTVDVAYLRAHHTDCLRLYRKLSVEITDALKGGI